MGARGSAWPRHRSCGRPTPWQRLLTPHTPSHAAGRAAGPGAPSRQEGRAQGSSPSFPLLLVAAAEKKTFVPTHARLPNCVRRFDGRGSNLDRFPLPAGEANPRAAEHGISQGLQMTPPVRDIAALSCVTRHFSPVGVFLSPQQVTHAKKSQSGIPERQKSVELSRLLGHLVIYSSVVQAKPFTHHLL